jgi:hypothetical protein
VHAGPGDMAGRLIGPSGQTHHRFQPAGPDQPGQRVAQRAVTDQVGRRWRVPEGECLNEHIGCLVAAQPPGEARPRPRESRRWPGGQPLHRRAPRRGVGRRKGRPGTGRRAVRENRVDPPGRIPGLPRVVAPGQDIGWCSLATSGTWAAAGPAPGPPGAHHAGVPPAGPDEPGGQASRRTRPRASTASCRRHDFAYPVGARGPAGAGGKLQARQGSLTCRRVVAMPRRRSATGSAGQLHPARFQCVKDAHNPHPAFRPGVAAALPAHRTTRPCLMANRKPGPGSAAPGSRANPYSGTGGPRSGPARRPP